MNVNLYGGVQAFPWQKELHRYISGLVASGTKGATTVVKAARQSYGKTTAAKAEIIRYMCMPRTINAYVAPTYKLCLKMFKELENDCHQLIKSSNRTEMTIEFITGSTLGFFSSEQRQNLRGFTVTGILVIDEAAYIPDDIYTELIKPWTRVHSPLTLIISTPSYKMGFFYDLFNAGLNDGPIKTFDWSGKYPADETLPFLQEAKRITPMNKYQSEYLGNFLSGDSSVFSGFEKCFDNCKDFKELNLGLDFSAGMGGDATELIGLNENGKMCLNWSTSTMEPGKQIDTIYSILEQHRDKIKVFIAEKNGIGNIYLNMIAAKIRASKMRFRTEWFLTTNDSKRALVENLQLAFETSGIGIWDDDELSTQLIQYEATINKNTNSVSYNAAKGFHDDKVIALMLAYRAYSIKQVKYHIH